MCGSNPAKHQIQRETINPDVAATCRSCVNLYQPWADAVVEGIIPVLARSFPTRKKGEIGIAATEGIDVWIAGCLTEDELVRAEELLAFNRVIGTVEIVDCLKIPHATVWTELESLSSRKSATLYPPHLVPEADPVFLWVLSNPRRYYRPIPIDKRGITWSTAFANRRPRKSKTLKNPFWNIVSESRLKRLNAGVSDLLMIERGCGTRLRPQLDSE